MIYILILGSNLGNREENLQRAERLIALFAGKILKRSKVYETKPFGVEKQPHFLNYGIALDSNHPPLELLRLLKWIEGRCGRFPTFRWGPRTVDIDIVLTENIKHNTNELKIPHPGLRDRGFFKQIVEELGVTSLLRPSPLLSSQAP